MSNMPFACRWCLHAGLLASAATCVVSVASAAPHALPPDESKLRPYHGPVIVDEPQPELVSAQVVDYTFYSASFGAAIGYCSARHGIVEERKPGGECFERAKALIATLTIANDIAAAKETCRSRPLQTCLTPEVARMIQRLLAKFRSEGL
jgi:hypothetical protein